MVCKLTHQNALAIFSTNRHCKRLLLIIVSLLLFTQTYATTRYVRPTSQGSGDGSSWSNASNSIQNMINSSSTGDDIYVASGTYTLGSTLQWNKGVNIYGGFNNSSPESLPKYRVMAAPTYKPWNFANATILDGSNNKQILYQSTFASSTYCFDGFTLQNGATSGHGGGIYLSNGGTVRKCIISKCKANDAGGNENGGGVYIDADNTILEQSLIFNCTANDYGGGVAINNRNAVVNRCHISNCFSNIAGGGINIFESGVIVNSILTNNQSGDGGGARLRDGGSIINCTVENNKNAHCTGSAVIYDMCAGKPNKAAIYNTLFGPNNGAIQNVGLGSNPVYDFWSADRGRLERIADYNTYPAGSGNICDDRDRINHFDGQLGAPADYERPYVKIDGYNTVDQIFSSYSSWVGYDNTKLITQIGEWTLKPDFNTNKLKDKGDNNYYVFGTYGNYDIYGNPRWLHSSIDIGATEALPTVIPPANFSTSSVVYNAATQEAVIAVAGETTNVKTTLNGIESNGFYELNYTSPSGALYTKSNNPTDAAVYSLEVEVLFRTTGKWGKATISYEIQPKPLSVTFPGISKVYNGTTTATIPALTVSGAAGGQTITASATSAAYATASVGTNKTVTVNGVSFTAPTNSNYTLSTTASNTLGTITSYTPGAVSITFPNQTKVYDRNTSVAAIPLGDFTISGLPYGQAVTVSGYTSAVYNNIHAGTGKTISITGLTFTGADAGNYVLPTTTTNNTSTITKKAITIIVNAGQTKVYDKNSSNPATYTYTASPLIAGDSYVGALSRTSGETAASYAINQGTLTPFTTGEPSAGANYDVSFTSDNFIITKKTLTITGLAAQSKVYDATATAAITGGTLNGVVAGDAVTFSYSANFADKKVGVNKPITSTFNLVGDAVINNYNLTQPSGFTASISQRPLSVTGISIVTKPPVPGDKTATIENWGALVTVINGDAGKVNIKQSGVTATFSNDIAGTWPVTISTLDLEGLEAANYSLTQPSGITGTISTSAASFAWTPNVLTKTYDGLGFVVTAKEVTSNSNATIEYDFGAGWVSTVPIDAGSYSVRATSTDGTYIGAQTRTMTISKKPLSAATFANNGTKVYDNSTIVVGSKIDNVSSNLNVQPTLILAGIEARDMATVTAIGDPAVFSNKDAGSNKTVTINNVKLLGTGSSNYTIPSVVTNNTWSIAKVEWPLVFTIDNQTKIFDGTTTVKINSIETIPSISISGFISGDVFTATAASASYDTPLFGIGNKKVTLSGIIYSNNAANNYILPTELTNTTSSITQLPIEGLKMTLAPQIKTYDGTTDVKDAGANVYVPSIIFTNLIPGFEDVVATGQKAFYDNKNAGNNKTVTVKDFIFTGAHKDNYSYPDSVINTTSAISQLPIPQNQITFPNQTKEYDGTTAVKDANKIVYVPQLTVNGLIPGDVVTALGSSATYDDKNVASGKTITIGGVVYAGADANNYTFSTVLTNNNNTITPIILKPETSVVFADQTKVYDGTTSVKDANGNIYIPTLTINGLITGDVVTALGSSATYDDKNVATGKTITIGGIVYAGVDANNYTLPAVITSNNNTITPIILHPLTSVVFADQTKVYDGTTSVKDANGNIYIPALTINGLIAGDVVTALGSSASYDNKNVAFGKTITIGGIVYAGADVNNYTLPTVLTSNNNTITPIILKPETSVVFADQSKVYDGTTSVKDANGNIYIPSLTINGLVAGDVVTALGSSAIYDDKNVATGKTVTIGGVIYAGADANNYTLPAVVTSNSNTITPIILTPLTSVTFSNQTKIYDKTTVVKDINDNIYIPTITVSGILSGDEVIATGTNAAYDNPEGGIGKTITISGISYSGADAKNYTLPTTISNNGNSITKIDVIRKWGYVLLVDNPNDELVAYQWYKNDILIPGEIHQYYSTPEKTLCGEYFCKVTTNKGKITKTPIYSFSEGCITSKSMMLYPNPNKPDGQFYFKNIGNEVIPENNAPSTIVYSIEIFSAAGQLISRFDTDSLYEIGFQTPSAAGVYLVSVAENNEKPITYKLVVTH